MNIGAVSTKGLDFTSHYHMDIGAAGKLSFNFSGTYTKDFETALAELSGEEAAEIARK